jgi:carbamoyl-phosphate synthase large subunit
VNVLITSAGRRTSLLAAFKAAAHRRGGQVFAGDLDGLAPALYLADAGFRLPRVSDAGYLETLLELVERHRIALIVPTIDPELPLLAGAAGTFADRGCHVLISRRELIQAAGDKWETVRLFGHRDVRVPASWLPEQLPSAGLPDRLFVKPRAGSASQHTYRTRRAQLADALPRVPHPIIQEEIEAPEVTIDALLDFEGRPLHYVPRLRLRTVGGESIQGVTIGDRDLRDWMIRVLEITAAMGAQGPITLQAFLTDEGPILSEVNPRFGGGFPLCLAAGGDYPEWIMQMLEGKRLAPRIGEYRANLYMTRYYREIITDKPLWR